MASGQSFEAMKRVQRRVHIAVAVAVAVQRRMP
jgi:hypothetical protein